MKYFTFVILTFYSLSMSAQDFYVNLQTGYGFATEAGQANYTNITYDNNLETKEIIAGGFGEGIYIKSSIGYQHNNLISLELGVNYLFGRTITVEEENIDFLPSSGLLEERTYSRNIQGFIFSPQLVVTLPNESNLKPYIKTGAAIGVLRGNFQQDLYSNNGFEDYTTDVEYLLNGGTPFGFTATLGTQYLISENLSFLADFSLLNMSYRPYRNTITQYIENDVDAIDNLSTRQREVVYNNKIETDSNVPPNNDEPRRALPISLPMSNVTFNVGLQLRL